MLVIDCWSKSRSAVTFVKSMVKSFTFANAASREALASLNSPASVFECFFEATFSFSNSLFSKSSSVFTSYTRDSAAAN